MHSAAFGIHIPGIVFKVKAATKFTNALTSSAAQRTSSIAGASLLKECVALPPPGSRNIALMAPLLLVLQVVVHDSWE